MRAETAPLGEVSFFPQGQLTFKQGLGAKPRAQHLQENKTKRAVWKFGRVFLKGSR